MRLIIATILFSLIKKIFLIFCLQITKRVPVKNKSEIKILKGGGYEMILSKTEFPEGLHKNDSIKSQNRENTENVMKIVKRTQPVLFLFQKVTVATGKITIGKKYKMISMG